jgi:hypothetical protein
MVIWIVGYLFTMGFVADEKAGFWADIGLILIWPVALGIAANQLFKKIANPPDQPQLGRRRDENTKNLYR